jgi:PAS domain S-box-containing protein
VHFGDYQAGYRFGQLGYDLVEKHGLKRFQVRTYAIFGNAVMPWTRHVKAGRDLVRRAFEMANQTGDLGLMMYSWFSLISNLLAAGDPLVEVQRTAENGLEFARKIRYGRVSDIMTVPLALIRTLRGLTPTFGRFDDEQFDELRIERRFSENPDLALYECWYWIRKLQARFLAGDHPAAIEASSRAQRLLWRSPSHFGTAEYHFYSALSRAACCDSVSADGRQQSLNALADHQRQLDIWAANCPENFENRAALVSAEIARIEGRALDAERLYEQAIRSAHSNDFVQNEAIAYEVAARFYAARGFQKFADAYLLEARYCYQRWGADGKLAHLNHLYPHLKKDGLISTPTSTILAPAELLDLATVIKVSQAVSGEMILEKLIDRVMRAAIEHAGAERGLLILLRDDELRIEAEATTSGDTVIVGSREVSVTAAALAESIVHYVVRTQESVILDDASPQNPFSADEYIREHHARSILCLPLLKQAKLIGVLYLENNLTSHVFTPNRIALLKVLASQAAISLENTRLYGELTEREARIRRLVEANIIGIVIWNFEGQIIEANEAFLRIVGYGREDLVSGRVSWREITPAKWRAADEQALAELAATGICEPFEKEYFRKDGSRVPVMVGAAFLEGSRDEGVAFVLDLGEQKRAEEEIRALKDQLYKENLALRDEVDRASMFEEIVGTSKPLKAVLSRIAQVAPTDSTVFITGETGTGKELLARAVHKRSQRSERAFVSVNCAALAPSLISSELFGHEKGAFTGATQRRLGRFELADGGTIFLDEVGELPPDTQVALLRVLQEREFERVGGGQPIHVDVRVIAATNRDLKAAAASGTFRPDLFYRLNVFPIEVPPLRERKDDILLLLEYFVKRYASRIGKNIRSIDKKTLELFQSYSWPGNIRELQNVIERSVIISSGDVLSVDESWFFKEPSQIATPVQSSQPVKAEPRDEREIIEAALGESRGRVSGPSGAAAKLAIPPSTLEYRIKVLKINKGQFKFGYRAARKSA